MQLASVSKRDLDSTMSLLSLLGRVKLRLAPTEAADVADLMAWVREMARMVGKTWQDQAQKAKAAAEAPGDAAASAATGLNIKTFHPGELA